MPKTAHRLAAVLATLTIATFFRSTILADLSGSHATVDALKALLVVPGLFLHAPPIR